MKVALVHDFLMQMGGAENVLETLHDMFPNAPIYTSIYSPSLMSPRYRTWDIRTSFLQRFLLKQHLYRNFLLLYPMAFESFDLSSYDLVISSSSAFAKGIITQPHTVHICYTYTPMRFAWSSSNYIQNEKLSLAHKLMLNPVLHYLRTWDVVASNRVDKFIAISSCVADRIEKFYRRESEIIYPPVNTSKFQAAETVGDYFLIASRSIPYKRIDLAVDAFTKLKMPLIVVGTGRHNKELRKRAGQNITFLGYVSEAKLQELMSAAKAYIMPGEEDFGIAPVEANACGRPVIAFGKGGALDTQIDGVTGTLFKEQSVGALCEAVSRAEKIDFDSSFIQAHARQFDTLAFRRKVEKVCGIEGIMASEKF